MLSIFAAALGVFLPFAVSAADRDCSVSDGLPIVRVCPSHVESTTKLSITVKSENPFRELAVFTPSGESNFLVLDDYVSPQFKGYPRKDYFQLTPTTLKGSKGMVFQESGRYTFYFADNAETERENATWSSVTIDYVRTASK
jgi:hypothetical protein